MNKILTPDDEKKDKKLTLVDEKKDKKHELTITYQPTERDEEEFFLMYNMNLQPSEVQALDDEYRQWLIARFIAQKNMEKEAFQRHQLMNQLGPDLKGGLRVK